MKEYVPVIFAAVLLIIALVLIVRGVSNLAGLPVLSAGSYAFGYLAGGNFSGGVFAAGVFSAGVFAAGVFAVGSYGGLQVLNGTQLVFVAGSTTNVLDADITH